MTRTFPAPVRGGNAAQQGRHLCRGRGDAATGIDNEMRPPPLLRIGHLLAHYRGEALLSHARTGEHPLLLHRRGGRYADDRIDEFVAACLEQQRNIEHDQRRAGPRGVGEKRVARCGDERMHDGFEARESCGIIQNARRQDRPVDGAVASRAGESRLDRRRGRPGIERVHGGIGIMDADARGAKQVGRDGFAHSDGPRQAEHEHQVRPSMSAAIRARSAGVTAGRQPNQRSKPGAA